MNHVLLTLFWGCFIQLKIGVWQWYFFSFGQGRPDISSGIGENKRIRKRHISNETKIIGDRKVIKSREYVVCIYNKKVWYGIVEEYCE